MRCFFIIVLVFASSAAHATFLAVDVSVTANRTTGLTTFNALFNETPDFFTVDGIGRQADAFQFWLTDDVSASFFDTGYGGSGTSVIRGGEINLGAGIPICSILAGSQPTCGGWGEPIGAVDFDVTGALVTFSVSSALLGIDDPSNPPARWFLQTAEFGGCTGPGGRCVIQTGTVPEPGTLGLLGLGMVGLGLARRRQVTPGH